MKQINNRQKMIVKPRESVQKYVLSAGKLQKGKRVKNQKSNGRRREVITFER